MTCGTRGQEQGQEGVPDAVQQFKAVILDNVVAFIPPGKIRCYITGQLRPDKPEEHVRQRWARSLVDEYKYGRPDVAVEFRIKMGSAAKRADLVIFKPGGPHRQDSIFIIVEAKRADVLPKDKAEGVEQLRSYMAASSSCRYGLWVGSEKVAYQKLDSGAIVETTDIPRFGDLEPKPPDFKSLTPAVDLKAALRRCHNYIYANQGIQKAEAFHELQKLIFCKVLDEYETAGALRFLIRGDERLSEAGQRRVLDERIAPLFEEVKQRYQYIFDPGEAIKLNRKVLSYIVSELQRYSLLRTNTDVKGAAYEELVGENLRGDRGEFFTPRNVCDMAVRMALSLFQTNKLTSLRVLDCCCGTGGFLVSAINRLRDVVHNMEAAKGGTESDVQARTASRVKEIAERNLFGLDINPFLVRTTQMNLVMHGDGSVNVFPADSLVAPGEWDDEIARKKIQPGSFDICVTNPPFGGRAIIDDPHVLSRYELPQFGSPNMRSSMPAEQLFAEASLKYVKPGGYLAIVLPDSILNNPGLEFIRQWLSRRARMVASIDLPKETFADSGGVPNPSVLILQRLTKEEIKLAEANALDDYEIFMAIPRTSGIDKRGNPVYYKTPEGFEILNDRQEPTINDELPLVAKAFDIWRREAGYGSP
jgi:type I restriction enzyme M protein